jgi:hypothetical protein
VVSRRKDGSYRYDSAAWRQLREQVFERDGGLCRLRLPGCEITAVEVDHVVDIAMGGAVLDERNCPKRLCALSPATLELGARSDSPGATESSVAEADGCRHRPEVRP